VWRPLARALGGLCALLVLAGVSGAVYQRIATRNDLAANPPPGRLVDVGGHRLHIWCTGSGEPTVVLESGLGGSSLVDWSLVQPEVARFTRVCSYDRAGMGYSDPGPSPRTAQRITRELAGLLDRAEVHGPLVLVGASIGGLFARVFASAHADRVAGLVLVDASHEDQKMDMPRIAPLVPVLASTGVFRLLGVSFGPPAPPSLPPSARRALRASAFRASTYEATANEGIHLPETAAEVRASRRQLNIPVVVVTAGIGSDAAWQSLQRDQVGLSEQGCQVIAEQSGHGIALGQPLAIVEPIRALVRSARAHKKIPLCGNAETHAHPSLLPTAQAEYAAAPGSR
jgi:pimeloyl-ACP methyl ester carboxylesterase